MDFHSEAGNLGQGSGITEKYKSRNKFNLQ